MKDACLLKHSSYLSKSAVPDEMPHIAAFHLGLPCSVSKYPLHTQGSCNNQLVQKDIVMMMTIQVIKVIPFSY